MRLWHKDLIEVLPRRQLLSQWRECCCIARNIKVNGTPNHLLVNKIMDFSFDHFMTYSRKIWIETYMREYNCDWNKFCKYISEDDIHHRKFIDYSELFDGWHNDRYLRQCYYNLQEKYDCGGIPEEEWKAIVERIGGRI